MSFLAGKFSQIRSSVTVSRIRFFALTLLFLFFLIELSLIVIAKRAENTILPPLFGNFPGTIKSITSKEPSDRFCFAIAGDTRSNGTFEELLWKIEKKNPDFLILLGDCVDSGTKTSHRYFKAERAEQPVPFPILYIVGNHDIDPQSFTVNDFEKNYGPSNFSFVYNNCLFIGLRILSDLYPNDDSILFLKDTLRKFGACHYQAIFVFMHVPPPIDFGLNLRKVPKGEELISLFNRFHVDYVFAGDYHGYTTVRIKNTEYNISGGGGSPLYGHRTTQFHHVMIITVTPEKVQKEIIYQKRAESLEDRIEHYAITKAYPWFSEHIFTAVIINMLLGFVTIIYATILRSRR